VVVVAALWGALGVAARPGGHIHREHQRVGVGQGGDQQVTKPLDLDATTGQRVVGAAPAAPTDRLQAQVRQGGDRLSAQQRVAQLDQRIGTADAAGVQLGPEPAEPHQRRSWHWHGRAACQLPTVTGNLTSANTPAGLSHKLSP
jgi:hypothetical protein